jgi:hypothetical protein
MLFRSKVDAWLGVLVGAAVVIPTVAGVLMLASARPDRPEGWVPLGVGVFIALLVGVVAWPVSYEITPTHLVIRTGLLHSRIALSGLTAVRRTRNPLSAPAWSMDRLQIDYSDGGMTGSVLVSPADREGFLRQLREFAPGLKQEA